MVAQIIAILDKILSFAQMIAAAFKKTPSEIVQSDKDKVKAEIDEFKKTGIPPR